MVFIATTHENEMGLLIKNKFGNTVLYNNFIESMAIDKSFVCTTKV